MVDDRSPTAKALSKVSEITGISLLMIFPAIGGYFIDQWLHTVILFTAIGLILGFGGAIWQLFQFVKHQNQPEKPNDTEANEPPSVKPED